MEQGTEGADNRPSVKGQNIKANIGSGGVSTKQNREIRYTLLWPQISIHEENAALRWYEVLTKVLCVITQHVIHTTQVNREE